MCTVIKEGGIMSFQELKDKFLLSNQDHFRYLQLRDYFNKAVKPTIDLAKNSVIKAVLETYIFKGKRTTINN